MALARRTCSSNGGNLASITSAEENEEVTRIANGNVVWIGGIRKGSGNGPGANHWYWSDGRPWTYTNWHPGEPNNYGGVENRVQLGLGAARTWNDVHEGWNGPAVYEFFSRNFTCNNFSGGEVRIRPRK